MISIIDDDRSVREAVKSLIRSLGYDAVTFASAEEYLGADGAHDSECIITDVQMPGMTGIDLDPSSTVRGRCLKDMVEERLFAHRRDLFTRLDLVFMDTTSLYFEGAGGQSLGQHGYSKDHRPDLRQMILAVLLDGDGRPVCSEMWPGNTADVTTLIPVIDRLGRRFDIARVCVVADRGMISAETMAELEARRLL